MQCNEPVLIAPSFVIQRRLAHPLREVQLGLADRAPLGPSRLIELPAFGYLYVDEPFRPVSPLSPRQPVPTWRAPARLLTGRRTVVALIELEVSMWSHNASDLQLRPVARHPERWSGRRLRRYFSLAHLAADATARLVNERADAAIGRLDAELAFAARAERDRVGSRR